MLRGRPAEGNKSKTALSQPRRMSHRRYRVADSQDAERFVRDQVDREEQVVAEMAVLAERLEGLPAPLAGLLVDRRDHAAVAAAGGPEGHLADAQPATHPAVLGPGRRP